MIRRRQAESVWYGLLLANLATIGWYWWQGSGSLLAEGGAAAVVALGRLGGLLLAATVLLQFTLMGRLPLLERVFGLDRLARLHHLTGQLVVGLLLLHPVLLTLGYSRLHGVNLWTQFWLFIFDYEHVLWAGVGALFFLIVVATSIAIVRNRWRYEAWYAMHLLVYAAVGASVWHQFSVGSDLLASRVFYTYWAGLYVVVLGNHLVWRILRPVYLTWRHRFTVSRIERETPQAVSLYITGRDLARFPIVPGQFMILRFLTRGRWWQAHPFSLSRLPDGTSLRVTVKQLGDFTRGVHEIPPGTRVIIDGPYGVFTEWVRVTPRVLFIAGGIGITPIRSLFEAAVRRGTDAVLLYGNRRREETVFAQELGELEQRYGGRVVPVLSDEPGFAGERGYIDGEKIQRLVPDVRERDIYVCGPPPMVEGIRRALQTMGVPPARIHFEKFIL